MKTWRAKTRASEERVFSPPDRFEMFFQLFFGGMTLKMIPSENGSRESTNSSSAFPPSVIICRKLVSARRRPMRREKTNLIHLFELHRDDTETFHELLESLIPQIVVHLLRGVPLLRHDIEISRSFHKLSFPSCVFLEDSEIETHVPNSFYVGINQERIRCVIEVTTHLGEQQSSL